MSFDSNIDRNALMKQYKEETGQSLVPLKQEVQDELLFDWLKKHPEQKASFQAT